MFFGKKLFIFRKESLTNPINLKCLNFLPYENLIYTTHLSKEEILKQLQEVTEPKKNLRWKGIFADKNHLPYEGIINQDSFKINRITDDRNSFLPQIEGRIEAEVEGNKKQTRIHIKMRLHTFVLVFMGIWLTVVGFISIGVLSSLFFSEANEAFNIAIVIPFFMFLVGLSFPNLAFHYEGNKSKEFFENLLEVERQEN